MHTYKHRILHQKNLQEKKGDSSGIKKKKQQSGMEPVMSVTFTRRTSYAILIMHHKEKREKHMHGLFFLNNIYNNPLQIR